MTLPKTLVILLSQDREISRTIESLKQNVLKPINGDLALFGVPSRESERVDYSHTWLFEEPVDWKAALTNAGLDEENFAKLGSIDYQFLSQGTKKSRDNGEPPGIGSGAIVFYWRYMLSNTLRNSDLRNKYDWFLISRSDMLWQRPHPPIQNFDEQFVYFLDGEHYFGVSDRYVLFHRENFLPVVSACDSLFENPGETYLRLRERRFLNPEVFLLTELERAGVMGKARFLPYMPFAIRSVGGVSRWSLGTWNRGLQVFVKYRSEYCQAKSYGIWIRNTEHWGRYPSEDPSFRIRMGQLSWAIAGWTLSAQEKIEGTLRFYHHHIGIASRKVIRFLKGKIGRRQHHERTRASGLAG